MNLIKKLFGSKKDHSVTKLSSLEHTVPNAIKEMKKLNTIGDINSFIKGDSRVGVNKAAQKIKINKPNKNNKSTPSR